MQGKRSNWNLVKVAVLLVLTAVGACAAGPEIIKLAGKGTIAGEVTFSHAKHTDSVDSDGCGITCDRCHHAIMGSGQPERKCRGCHKRDSEKPVSMEVAAHNLCMGCHKERAGEEPSRTFPSSCPDCHVFKEEVK